jgi:hypothetical protein
LIIIGDTVKALAAASKSDFLREYYSQNRQSAILTQPQIAKQCSLERRPLDILNKATDSAAYGRIGAMR